MELSKLRVGARASLQAFLILTRRSRNQKGDYEGPEEREGVFGRKWLADHVAPRRGAITETPKPVSSR
jgi:hypothetical protein